MICAEGISVAAISRELVTAISPHCDDNSHARLVSSIHALGSVGGEGARQKSFIEYLLLRCLQANRLAPESMARLKELEKEFPEVSIALPHAAGAGFRARTLPGVDFSQLSDEQWM